MAEPRRSDCNDAAIQEVNWHARNNAKGMNARQRPTRIERLAKLLLRLNFAPKPEAAGQN
jgi:hypothetical protein